MGLQSSESIKWCEALQSEEILGRILWIVENTLSPLLIEKVVISFMFCSYFMNSGREKPFDLVQMQN